MKNTLRFIGIDPGTKNYAIVVIDSAGKVLASKLFEKTVRSCAADSDWQIDTYHNAVIRFLNYFKPTAVGAEAFVVRGFSTVLTQFVNLMLGILWAECNNRNIQRVHISSSTWKGNIKKIGDLTKLYKFAKTQNVAPHLVDALCIALYTRNGKDFLYEDRKLIELGIKSIANAMPPPKQIRRKRVSKDKMLGKRT